MTAQRGRCRVEVTGVVQGVGFRPFVYALARELGLAGSVANTSAGVVAEIEGRPAAIEVFLRRVGADAPPLAVVEKITSAAIPVCGGTDFVIEDSAGGPGRTMVALDPPFVANEGKLVAFVAPDDADAVLAAMRTHEYGTEAVVIGECVEAHPGMVVTKTGLGGTRVVDFPIGEQLPRIC